MIICHLVEKTNPNTKPQNSFEKILYIIYSPVYAHNFLLLMDVNESTSYEWDRQGNMPSAYSLFHSFTSKWKLKIAQEFVAKIQLV